MVDTIVAVLITKIQCRMVGVRPKYIEYVSTVIKYAIQEKKKKTLKLLCIYMTPCILRYKRPP